MEIHDLEFYASFSIHGLVMNIRTNSAASIGNFEQECGHFQVPFQEKADFTVYAADDNIDYPDGSKNGFSYDIDAFTRLTVNILKKEAILTSTNTETLPFFLWQVSESMVLALMREKGLPCMHAAAIEKYGRGILFPAMICSGKTTLTIELVKEGYRYLADDLVFINNDLDALCFPTRIGVTEYTQNRFSDIIKPESLIAVPYSYKKYFRLENLFPGSIADKCRPDYIIFPSPGKKTDLKKLSKTEALIKLIPSMYNDNELLRNYHTMTGFDKSSIFDRAADLVMVTEQFGLTVGESGAQKDIAQLF